MDSPKTPKHCIFIHPKKHLLYMHLKSSEIVYQPNINTAEASLYHKQPILESENGLHPL
jgi:hypothetical protein